MIQVLQAGKAELARAVHDRVVGEGRVEGRRLTRIRADRLDPDAEYVSVNVVRRQTRFVKRSQTSDTASRTARTSSSLLVDDRRRNVFASARDRIDSVADGATLNASS